MTEKTRIVIVGGGAGGLVTESFFGNNAVGA